MDILTTPMVRPAVHSAHAARRWVGAQSSRRRAYSRDGQRDVPRTAVSSDNPGQRGTTAIRGRQRQYECRKLNDEQESRVAERTAELAAANRELVTQIKERENVESTLLQMQRLEAVGQLTSGVAHDFNNLLTVVLGNLTFLERGLTAAGIDGKLFDRLGYIRAAAERGAKLTD